MRKIRSLDSRPPFSFFETSFEIQNLRNYLKFGDGRRRGEGRF